MNNILFDESKWTALHAKSLLRLKEMVTITWLKYKRHGRTVASSKPKHKTRKKTFVIHLIIII